MKSLWKWKCPICDNTSEAIHQTSGRARKNGNRHLWHYHNNKKDAPILIKVKCE